MRLFISSFNQLPFAIRMAVYFLLVGLCYSLLLCLVPERNQGANQWQTNVVKAQRYMFSKKQFDHIVVGSSEMFRVPVEKDSNWANLAMAGGASQTGLELIAEKIRPRENSAPPPAHSVG